MIAAISSPGAKGERPFRAAVRRAGAVLLAVFLGSSLIACEQNPFDGLMKHVDQPIPGKDQPYPNLSSVPDKAPKVTPKEERAAIQQDLTSDSQGDAQQSVVGSAPPIPAAPPSLPPGFATAQVPMKIPAAGSQASSVPSPGAGATTPGKSLRVAIVLFDPGSAAVDPAQRAALEPVVRRLHVEGRLLQVVGYAVANGRDRAVAKAASDDLAAARADAVARELSSLGVKPGEILASAEGDSAPTIAVAGVSARAARDRADIFLEY